ncbi:MAG: YciI family protein [Alphaproteobacteria bacterium]|nr:YciI family protein [Alphaproteobacteria bacterium]
MLYAVLCYNTENTVFSWSKEHEQKVMDDLTAVQDKYVKARKLGPVARLMPTTAATTLRKGEPPLVLDGPFAETREQLLGFYVINAADLQEVLGFAKELGAVNPGGAYEIRPLLMFDKGTLPA